MDLDQQVTVIECSLPEFVPGFAVHGFLLDAGVITEPDKIIIDNWYDWKMRGNC